MSMPVDDIMPEIDLSNYIDPHVEAIMLQVAAAGDAEKVAAFKAELRREEARGWCKILMINDDVAVIRWHDQFVITIADKNLSNATGEA